MGWLLSRWLGDFDRASRDRCDCGQLWASSGRRLTRSLAGVNIERPGRSASSAAGCDVVGGLSGGLFPAFSRNIRLCLLPRATSHDIIDALVDAGYLCPRLGSLLVAPL